MRARIGKGARSTSAGRVLADTMHFFYIRGPLRLRASPPSCFGVPLPLSRIVVGGSNSRAARSRARFLLAPNDPVCVALFLHLSRSLSRSSPDASLLRPRGICIPPQTPHALLFVILAPPRATVRNLERLDVGKNNEKWLSAATRETNRCRAGDDRSNWKSNRQQVSAVQRKRVAFLDVREATAAEEEFKRSDTLPAFE